MKKIIALVLSMLVVLSLFAGCAEGGNEETTAAEVNHTLSVGFSRVDITPTESVPLAGYGNADKRYSTEIKDNLYATCIAMTDEAGNTILLYYMDLHHATTSLFPMFRLAISKKVGIPGVNVQLATTHIHSAPDTANSSPAIERYNEFLQAQLVTAAEEAMADRKLANMYATTVYPKNLNFVRHYWLSDGTSLGDNHGYIDEGDTIVEHISEADNSLQMIKFVREGDKDVVLVNWQSHPHRGAGGGSATYITADLVGVMRDYVEEEMDCHFAYFTGASGNLNPSSRISSEVITKNYIEQGKALGQYVINNYDNFTLMETGTVQTKTATVTLNYNHEQEDLSLIATEMYAMWQATGNHAPSRKLGRPYGIHSVYHANAIMHRSSRGESGTIPISVFSIGNIAFVSAPYEMFDTSGMDIKENSPYKMTFIVTMTNEHHGYIPSQAGYEYGCYEADTTKFAPGSGEIVVDEYLKLLNALYETK